MANNSMSKSIFKNYEYLRRLASSAKEDSITEANQVVELYRNRTIRNITSVENYLSRLKDDSVKKRNTAKRHIKKNSEKWSLGRASASSVLKSVSSSSSDRPISSITLALKVQPRVTYAPKNLTAHTSVKFESKRTSKEIGKAQYKDNIHSILSKLTASVKQSAKRLLDANNGSAKLQLLFNYKRNQVYTKKKGDTMY